MKSPYLTEIKSLENPDDLRAAFLLLKELRPHIDETVFFDIYAKAVKADRYSFIGLYSSDKLIAIMGYRFLYDYVHGKHIYIDDLVTAVSERSQGHGAKLLKYAEDLALRNGCKQLRLCTGTENESGKKFYEKNGWNLRAVVYKKRL